MADFNSFADYEIAGAVLAGCGGLRTSLAFVYAADVGEHGPKEVAAGDNVAQVVVELVGAADHVLAALERFVDHHGKAFGERRADRLETDRTEITSGAVEEMLEFFSLHGAKLHC